MTKNEAVEKLKKAGYDATNTGGIIIFRFPKSEADKAEAISKKVKEALKDIGYSASWGISYSGTNQEAPTPDAIDDESHQLSLFEEVV